MSCLEATFTLTPRSPIYQNGEGDKSLLHCHGADFTHADPRDLSSLYASDRFYFDADFAGNPNTNYSHWQNRTKASFLTLWFDLRRYGTAQKQLALIFGFDVRDNPARVLVYSDAGLLQDQQLVYGDNQFLLELESVDQPVYLYFIHAGGSFFFKGLSGYVV